MDQDVFLFFLILVGVRALLARWLYPKPPPAESSRLDHNPPGPVAEESAASNRSREQGGA